MPKIKIKNIPYKTQVRICAKNLCNSYCPYYVDEMLVNDDLEHAICIKDSKYDSAEKCIEFSEKDFPTNREWMESLSNEDLALFMRTYEFSNQHPKTIEEWLSKPCVYLMERE